MRYLLLAVFVLNANFLKALDLTGRVVDEAGILTQSQTKRLDETILAHEKATTNQIVVVTIKSLNNQAIEEFGYKLGREWKIGVKDKNNGVLLIVAPGEREVRIEVGYGLEGVLTDAQNKLIIERVVLPSFKKGELGEGIVMGVQSIIDALGGQLKVPEPEEDLFTLVDIFSGVGIVILCLLVFFFGRRGGPRSRSNSFWTFGGRGGGGSGGTFSGGGGSFGGGGASGKW